MPSKWLYWLVQSPSRNYSRRQVLCTAIILFTLMAWLASALNWFAGLSFTMIWLPLIGSVANCYLYLKVRFTEGDEILSSYLFCYLSLFVMLCAWPLNNGAVGSIPPVLVTFIVMGAFVLPSTHGYLIYTLITVASGVTLTALDIHYPGWIPPYNDVISQKMDLGYSVMMDGFIIGICLYFFRIRYESEQQVLKSSVDYKSRFLAQMSHEMRTPLNAIIGFSRILSQTEVNAETRSLYLERIHDNGKSLLSLFEDLLDISKIEAGELNLNYDEVKLEELLQQCLSRYEQAAESKYLYLRQEFNGPYSLYTDPQRLKQIVSNLLSNAVKYTPPQEYVYMNTFTREHSLCIEVKDTGPGIREKEQEQIFTPFYRAEDQVNYKSEGSGLGLAIVIELCERMGYTLRLISEEGEGSTFQVWIPLQAPNHPVV